MTIKSFMTSVKSKNYKIIYDFGSSKISYDLFLFLSIHLKFTVNC